MPDEYTNLLLEESPDALVVTSPDSKVLHWNQGVETIFRFTAAELIGRRLSELIVPPDRMGEEEEIVIEALSARGNRAERTWQRQHVQRHAAARAAGSAFCNRQ